MTHFFALFSWPTALSLPIRLRIRRRLDSLLLEVAQKSLQLLNSPTNRGDHGHGLFVLRKSCVVNHFLCVLDDRTDGSGMQRTSSLGFDDTIGTLIRLA
jgi:hypothetical protein